MKDTIGHASAEEVAAMLDWAAAEGWNPGLGDAEAFLAADPGGFLVARVDGEAVASVSVVSYGEDFGFLGFYICRPEFRGKGHGWAVWQAGMARMGDRTVGLDGVPAQRENYRKSGFALAHRNVRYAGRVMVQAPADPRIRPVDPALAPAVIAFDRRFFPAPRDAFTSAWISGGGRRLALAFVDDGDVLGYGVIRPCRVGYKIGPLFALDEGIAEALFRALAAEANGAELFIDPPVPNGAATRLAEQHGMAPVFETARMYRGPAPHLPLGRTWGITTFELG
ncbi:GNAT family N-acetyltransferase [Prosthecomicrobium sp. N25]|uniref:GNAT family N-acetyltransferase n=1 Tax=Prosthecomicrobium sp. N25 TaxID=3129254 RepID=UPI0030773B07